MSRPTLAPCCLMKCPCDARVSCTLFAIFAAAQFLMCCVPAQGITLIVQGGTTGFLLQVCQCRSSWVYVFVFHVVKASLHFRTRSTRPYPNICCVNVCSVPTDYFHILA